MAPPRQGARFLGDYGQRYGAPQRANSGFKARTSSFGRRLMSHQRTSSFGAVRSAGDFGRDAAGVRDASRAEEEHEPPGDENAAVGKNVGAAEENVPRGQAHAGEEGKAVAAKAIASEVPLSPSSPAMRTLVREQLKELALL